MAGLFVLWFSLHEPKSPYKIARDIDGGNSQNNLIKIGIVKEQKVSTLLLPY